MAVPMELLSIKRGQKRRGLLIGDQQANLVKHAAQKPAVKLEDIKKWNASSQEAWRPINTGFGIEVGTQLTTVKGRLLPSPVLEYGQNKCYSAGTQGAWNMEGVRNLRCLKFQFRKFEHTLCMFAVRQVFVKTSSSCNLVFA